MAYAAAIAAIVGAIATGVSAGVSAKAGADQNRAIGAAQDEARLLNERDRRDRLKQRRVSNRLAARGADVSERGIGLQEKSFDYQREMGERSIRATGVMQAASILDKAAQKDKKFRAFLSQQWNPKVV